MDIATTPKTLHSKIRAFGKLLSGYLVSGPAFDFLSLCIRSLAEDVSRYANKTCMGGVASYGSVAEMDKLHQWA